MKQMSVEDYAQKRKVSGVAVRRAMHKNKQLVSVESYQKIGRDWILNVCNGVSKINKGTCVVVTHK